MLTELFPRANGRFSSLPLLGSVADDFTRWLFQRSYTRVSVRRHVRCIHRIDHALRQRGVRQLTEVTPQALRACLPAASTDHVFAAALRCWSQYLEKRGFVAPPPKPTSRSRTLLDAYAAYLRDVRGFGALTVAAHMRSSAELLQHLDYEATPLRLRALSAQDLENFLHLVGRRLTRATLQHVIAHVRGFLRFLGGRGDLRPGLETQIDTPRVYRLEQLPRAMPWKSVQKFLQSIDRRRRTGPRDYAIFLLIATYGLRAGEIAALSLDDVEWRAERIRIFPRKGGTPLLLPLTDEVGAALTAYLRRARPDLACRDVFLRCRAPAGAIKATAVTSAFRLWFRRSGLKVSAHGPHCLRHSYAAHLLRQGVPLKTLGDILGHRSAEATCMYLRLSLEDLRDVALPLPSPESREVEP
ncbi:MAG: site-specific integrase [Longimicrobiales bacterium]